MDIQPLPPAPIRATDADGNWINREAFKIAAMDWLYATSGFAEWVRKYSASLPG